jgi:hypothetical protein
MAAAIGYATVLNLNYAFGALVDPASAALRVVEFTLTQLALSTIIGFFLAELKLNRNINIVWMPAGLLASALLAGIAVAFRGGLVVGAISPTASGSTALQGISIAIFLVIVLFSSFYFLINNLDERAELSARSDFTR